MEFAIGTEAARSYYSLELAAAARKLVVDVMLAKPGENVVISADTQSDWRVVEATAQATYVAGATPTVILYETRPNAQMEPPPPVAAALTKADVWIEYAVAYTLYTDARREATRLGCRYGCMSAMDVDMLVRTIGKIDYPQMIRLGEKLRELTGAAREIRITDANGMDIRATLDGSPIDCAGLGSEPGALVMLGGQVGWLPAEASINGTIAFDATIWPPNEIGVVKTPVLLRVENGRIVEFSGAGEARTLEKWVAGFGDPNMYRLAHFTYGFNPGVTRATGRIVEDERLFGCAVFGFGGRGDRKAASHFDGVSSSPTVYLDGVPIECDGKYAHPQLVELCREMGVGGY